MRSLGTVTDAPPAIRAATPTWRDPRLWAGVALVAVSVVVGARVLATADDTVEVWAAAADLAQGQPVEVDDLMVRRIGFGDVEDGSRYLRVDGPLPEEATLLRPVGSGELLPSAALGTAPAGLVEVPVWASADAVPAGVGPGAVVDVWITPRPGSGPDDGAARRVLTEVLVLAAPRSREGFGPGGTRQLLVGVPEGETDAVGRALAAAKEDRVAVTRRR